jgi:phytanoyl-CoA hydroxylase
MVGSLSYVARARLAGARERVEKAARQMLWGGRPTWQRRPNTLPWLDQPDADARLALRPTDDLSPHLAQWVRDGWFVVDDAVDPTDIDAMSRTLDGLWDAPAPTPGINFLGMKEHVDEPVRDLSHAEILALPPERRARMRLQSHWRTHGFHYFDAAARRIFWNARLRAIASAIFDQRARPFAAINFTRGSQQALHQDMAVFHIFPHNFLLGVWIACEDITLESGPLTFHSGSHRAPMFPGFTNYPQTNLRTATPATSEAYQRHVNESARAYPREQFLARKGQALFWHGMLFHGGAPVLQPEVTRKSMVLHYTVRGADRAREVDGPFNW